MTKRYIAAGETLAIEVGAIKRDADGFYFVIGEAGAPRSHRHSSNQDVSIVYVRGSLEHHAGSGADNYEAILCRMRDAVSGKDVAEEGEAPSPPSAVIMCIDSRGGVVSGLNETVAAIRKLRKSSGIPFVAYVNELAASAAYAMACSCDEILCPKSAIMGSVGTISTMCSRSEADKREGLDVRLLTSGVRKADGHPHAPITDAAEASEQERVDKLADSFFELASQARGMAPDKFKALQAAIFLGPDAKKKGLADAVVSLDDLAGSLSKGAGKGPAAKGNETDRRAALDKTAHGVSSQTAQRGTQPNGGTMSVALKAMIATAEAALAAATDDAKKIKIQRRLDAFRLTLKAEEGGDDDDSGDDDDPSKAEEAAKKAAKAKKMAEAAKHRAKAAEYKQKAEEAEEKAKAAESDDDEGDDEEEKGSEASLSVATLASLPEGTRAAIVGLQTIVRDQGKQLAAMQSGASDRERAAMIADAKAARRITPHEAKMLAGKSMAFVKDFLAMRADGSAMVATEEGSLVLPADGKPQPAGAVSAEAMTEINERIAMLGIKDEKQAEAIRNEMIANRKKAAAEANGIGRF